MNIFAKAKKARENKKGFTLVELIVVLVILAILAAILVPALLGWIDKAKEKQYVLEARNVVLAAQTMADEAYASNNSNPQGYVENKEAEIQAIADVKSLSITSLDLGSSTTATVSKHDDYTISSATIKFKSSDGKTVNASLIGDVWEIKSVN